MRLKAKQWIKALTAAIVAGACNAGLASLGISGANMVGVKIPALDWKQLGAILISGGLIGALAYLKQSPVPPDDDQPQLPKPN